MNESFAEFFLLSIIMLFIVSAIIYGPMLIVGGLIYFAGLWN